MVKKEDQMKLVQIIVRVVVGVVLLVSSASLSVVFAQPPQSMAGANNTRNTAARSVTIPVTFRIKEVASEAELQTTDLVVSEDGEPQTITSIRSV